MEVAAAAAPPDPPRLEHNKLKSPSPLEGSAGGSGEHGAATKLQNAYRGYRTRRKLADSAVVVEELWWQAMDLARLSHSTVSFFDEPKPETAASRWNRVSLNASKVGQGLSRDGKALKLAFQHWIEAKYSVDKNGNNCFMLFPRGMSIGWAENPNYWTWQPLEEGSDGGDDAGIEVAELKNVCWLEITGKLELSHLTPGVTYEVVFEAMLQRNSSGWHVPVDLRLKFPDGRVEERKESLQERYSEEPLQLKAGEVEAREGLDGELVVSLSEHGGHWKRGLVVKGIRITPKE